MNGMNEFFMRDPVRFLRDVCVDNKTMQEGIGGANNIVRLNGAKSGVFDLVITGTHDQNQVRLTCVSPEAGYEIQGDLKIEAYWCPFLSGGGLPGWVDVPRFNPESRLVLTAAMQGCAFVITDSPASAQYFRVFHNQHPEASSTWAAIQQSGVNSTISTFSYEEYGNTIPGAGGGMTNAFNILWKPPGKKWSYVSQSNRFVHLDTGLGTRIERDHAKRILDRPVGV